METDINKLSPEIKEKIIHIQNLLNEDVDESSPVEDSVIFTPKTEEGLRKAIFKLNKLETGELIYEFDSISVLVW
jgi:hypothetical protein